MDINAHEIGDSVRDHLPDGIVWGSPLQDTETSDFVRFSDYTVDDDPVQDIWGASPGPIRTREAVTLIWDVVLTKDNRSKLPDVRDGVLAALAVFHDLQRFDAYHLSGVSASPLPGNRAGDRWLYKISATVINQS